MNNGHAMLSPSSAARWLACPASAREAASVVSPDTEYSLAGTLRHEAAARWIKEGAPPTTDSAVLADVEPNVNWVLAYLLDHPGTVMVEERTEIGTVFGLQRGACFGTADVVLLSTDEMVVFDHKFGYQPVPVERNVQLMLYALGLSEELGWLWPSIRLVIGQPKVNAEPQDWVISKADLLKWKDEVLPKVLAAQDPAAPYVPGEEQCRYCPAAGVCKALQAETLALARQEFSSPAALVEHISIEDLGLLLTRAGAIEGALKAAREHGTKLALAGVKVPGWRLVEARKNRAWKSESLARETLTVLGYDEDDIAPRKMVSPAQAEKLVKNKEVLAPLMEKPQGEPVLAPESDKRPDYKPFADTTDVQKLLE